MSGPVVYIIGGKCGRRKNRPEDAKTISLRRLISSMQKVAFADNRQDTTNGPATALAFCWAAERKLPCNQLRCIAGTLDERRDFEVRLADCAVARAERDLIETKWLRLYNLHGREAVGAMSDDREAALDRLWQAVEDLARCPAHTRSDLARKKRAIGVWLKAEGERYDHLRASIAADEERLTAGPAKGSAIGSEVAHADRR